MALIRRDVKGGKRKGYKPGERIWSEVAKELKCVHVITNEDNLCCGWAIVVMREYTKKQAGEANTFDNIWQDRSKKLSRNTKWKDYEMIVSYRKRHF